MSAELNDAVEMPAMTGAEMQSTREYLGFTNKWLADKFTIGERRLFRMESDRERIPQFLVSFYDEALVATKEIVDELAAVYRRKVKANDSGAPVIFLTYRSDEAYADADESVPGIDQRFCARWHRMVGARLAERVPGLIVSYWDVDNMPELGQPGKPRPNQLMD